MAKISEECISAARAALAHFSESDLREYVQEVFIKAKQHDNLSSGAAMDRAIKEVNEESLQLLMEEAAIKIKNTNKFERLANAIKSGTSDFREIFVRRYKNLGNNVESAQRAAAGRLSDAIYNDLSSEEIAYLQNRANNLEIARAMDGIKTSPEAKRIGDVLKKYVQYRNSELVLSNAMPLHWINQDRNLRAVHDSSAMLLGGREKISAALSREKYTTEQAKVLWIDRIKKYINLEKTFEKTKAADINGDINIVEADTILSRIYDNIINGYSEIFTKSIVRNDRQAIKKKQRMFFQWQNMESFVEYNSIYGKGDLFEAIQSDINASGNKIGTSEILGDSPYHAYLDLKDVQQKVKPMGGTYYRNTDLAFNHLLGTDKTALSPQIATFGANLRSLTSMARLPKLAIQSISDIAYAASFSKRWGYSYWASYGEHLKNLFNLVPSEERQYIAGQFKLMVDSHLGYVGRFIDSNNVGELMNKASMIFYRKIGIEALDKGNKISTMHVMAKHMGHMSDKEFLALPPELQNQLRKYEIGNLEWDSLRKNTKKGLFTLDNVNMLSESDLKDLHAKTGSKTSLAEMRNDLHRRVYSMFDVGAENAVLTPGAFIRSMMTQGARPGTWQGELMRFFTQFKGYPLTYIDRVLIQGAKDMDSTSAKMMWGAQMVAGTLPLSYLSMYLDNLVMGKSMPQLSEMNVAESEKFLFQLIQPSFGVFLSVLDPQNQNQNLLWGVLKSPSLALLGTSFSTVLSLISGEGKQSLKNLEKTAANLIPINTVPFLSPYMRQMLGDEPYLSPGQTQYYGA